MIRILVLFYILIFAIDLVNLLDLRTLVYSFLKSKRNSKAAKKIHLSQTKKDRVTLSYIKNYTKYPKEFDFFQKTRLIYSLLLIPQYIAFAIINYFSVKYTLISIAILGAIKLFIGILIASQFTSRISRFDKRYSKKKKQNKNF